MKKIFAISLLCLLTLGCAQYQQNYGDYAKAWATLAEKQGPIFKLGIQNGQVNSIEMGNFAVAMAMMAGLQKPSSEFVEFSKSLFGMAPYGALFGLGAIGIQNAGHNVTSNVAGTGNITGSQGNMTSNINPVTNTVTVDDGSILMLAPPTGP